TECSSRLLWNQSFKSRRSGKDQGARTRAFRRRRRPRERDNQAGRGSDEEARQAIRAAHLRRRGAWVPASAGWPRREEPGGRAAGVAGYNQVLEREYEIGK